MRPKRTLLLSDSDIAQSIDYEEVVQAVEKTWAEQALGRVINPPKLTLDLGESGIWPNYDGYMNAMPAYVGWLDVAGLKWAGGFWDNVSKGLPSIMGLILLVDPKTGVFDAVLEGSLITSLRTAAQSIVGIKHLARKDLDSVGIYGAGTQARYHALMLSRFFPSIEIRVYDTRQQILKKFHKDLAGLGVRIIEEHDPKQCANTDVVITLTTSKNPFLRVEWVRKGQSIFALGSYQEVYPEVIQESDKIVVDHLQQTLHRGALKLLADKGVITEKKIHATIGEIIAGLKRGRESDAELIFFEPVGTGMLDVAVATTACRKAVQIGLGQEFQFLRSKPF